MNCRKIGRKREEFIKKRRTRKWRKKEDAIETKKNRIEEDESSTRNKKKTKLQEQATMAEACNRIITNFLKEKATDTHREFYTSLL